MTSILLGWLVPGGGALLQKRYARAAFLFVTITSAFVFGLIAQGGNLWPTAAELQGLDGLTSMMAFAGAASKMLAGGPYLLAAVFGYSHSFLDSRIHEAGTILLIMAGLVNLAAIAETI
jgi:hypothetical protein